VDETHVFLLAHGFETICGAKLREKAKYNEDVARHFEAKLTTTTKIDLVSLPAASATDKIAR
jgi:hypothetical protein